LRCNRNSGDGLKGRIALFPQATKERLEYQVGSTGGRTQEKVDGAEGVKPDRKEHEGNCDVEKNGGKMALREHWEERPDQEGRQEGEARFHANWSGNSCEKKITPGMRKTGSLGRGGRERKRRTGGKSPKAVFKVNIKKCTNELRGNLFN